MALRNQIRIEGKIVHMELSRRTGESLWAQFDLTDLPKVNSYPGGRWYAKWNPDAQTFYVRSNGYGRKHVGATYLHRYLLDLVNPEVIGDHKNHNGLDNRRENLEISNKSHNGFNRRGAMSRTKSKIRNVYWNQREQKYMVWFVHNGKRYYFGYFTDIREAEQAAIRGRDEVLAKRTKVDPKVIGWL
jgi:hypothetical protein